MQRKVPFAMGEYYHIYARGVDKRLIFINDKDKKRFISLLYLCNSKDSVRYQLVQGRPLHEIVVGEKLVAIGSYCLMGNHFHLLVKEISEGGLSKFMKKLLTAYSMYFNIKYDKTGALFDGRFKAKHLDTDEYLKYIFAYIHLNPAKIIEPNCKEKGITKVDEVKKFLTKYSYSSYMELIGAVREESIILNLEPFPEYFGTTKDLTTFNSFIKEWLELKS